MKSTIKKNNGHHHRTRNNNGTLSSSPIKSLRKKKSSSNNNTSRNNSNNNDVEVKVKSKDEKIASIQERFSGIIFAILSGSCAAAAGMFGKLLFTSSPDQQQYHNINCWINFIECFHASIFCSSVKRSWIHYGNNIKFCSKCTCNCNYCTFNL
jgi:hypothetical protein